MGRKAYLDLDPVFTHYWHASGDFGARLDGHGLYYTIGENIGTRGCPIPTGGIRWRHTRQPVVLEHWPVSKEGARERFTTVASWRGPYGPVRYGDKTFGLKFHEFRKFIGLPGRIRRSSRSPWTSTRPTRRIGTASPRLADRGAQAGRARPGGVPPLRTGSGAEFSVAQGIYVETGSGWFSDRTVHYLASGKPALVQDTGFSRNYPVGDGFVAFRTPGEAVAGPSDPERLRRALSRGGHSAEEYFDSDLVLGRFVEEAGVAP